MQYLQQNTWRQEGTEFPSLKLSPEWLKEIQVCLLWQTLHPIRKSTQKVNSQCQKKLCM